MGYGRTSWYRAPADFIQFDTHISLSYPILPEYRHFTPAYSIFFRNFSVHGVFGMEQVSYALLESHITRKQRKFMMCVELNDIHMSRFLVRFSMTSPVVSTVCYRYIQPLCCVDMGSLKKFPSQDLIFSMVFLRVPVHTQTPRAVAVMCSAGWGSSPISCHVIPQADESTR